MHALVQTRATLTCHANIFIRYSGTVVADAEMDAVRRGCNLNYDG